MCEFAIQRTTVLDESSFYFCKLLLDVCRFFELFCSPVASCCTFFFNPRIREKYSNEDGFRSYESTNISLGQASCQSIFRRGSAHFGFVSAISKNLPPASWALAHTTNHMLNEISLMTAIIRFMRIFHTTNHLLHEMFLL